MSHKAFALLVVVLLLVTAGCSAGANARNSNAPATAVSSPDVPPAAAPLQSTAAPAATLPTTPSTTSGPSGGSAAPSSGQIRFVVSPDSSQASYKVREQLAQRSFPSDAIGTTKAITGSIVVDPNGQLVPGQSKFQVDLTSLQSDSAQRDRFIQRSTLQTDQYPTAVLVPTSITGVPSPLPASGDVTFQMVGDLTVHGVTRPTTWQVTAHVAGQDVTGKATTNVKFEDFSMSPPKVFVVLSVEDNINLEIDFHVVRQ